MAVYPEGADERQDYELAYVDPVTGDRWYRPKMAGYLTGAANKSDPSKVGVTIKTGKTGQ